MRKVRGKKEKSKRKEQEESMRMLKEEKPNGKLSEVIRNTVKGKNRRKGAHEERTGKAFEKQ